MGGKPVFDDVARPDTENDVVIELRLPRDQVADDVGAHHLFVNRVGHDVFAVERHARLGRAQPFQCLDQPARTGRRGDLGRREMADRGAAQLPVQPEQRHQVDRRQRVGRNIVEVGQVRRIEVGGVHQLGEQVLVDAVAAAAAVLVELDGDEGRLGLPASGGGWPTRAGRPP